VGNLDRGGEPGCVRLSHHGSMLRNYKQRIGELKDHHQKRAIDFGTVLDKGSRSAYQVASEIHWDVRYESWDLVPTAQNWFATGEAIARLKYLEEKRIIRS
jgi:hypothetical protein